MGYFAESPEARRHMLAGRAALIAEQMYIEGVTDQASDGEDLGDG